MAPKRSIRDVVLFLSLITFALFLIKFQLYDVDNASPEFGQSANFLEELDSYCNRHGDVSGLEANLESEGFELEGVTILLRHGDRTPMADEDNKSSLCHIDHDVNKFVGKYWPCLDPAAIDLVKSYSTSLYCRNSQLTTIGIEQHKKIGKFLKSKYRKLLSKRAILSTTNYSRSLLSVLSMLSEFSSNWCSSQKPYLSITQSIFFMTQECPAILLLKEAAPTIKKDAWPTDLAYIKRIFEVPDSDEDNWTTRKNPETVADYVQTKYCHNSMLPKLCHADDDLREREKHCVTFGSYQQYFSVFKSLFGQRAHHVNSKRANFLAAYTTFERVLNGTDAFAIYGGHDVSLEAVLTTMGHIRASHVPYASRLIFERWKPHKSKESLFRILLNGVPLTLPGLSHSHGLISRSTFVDFLQNRQQELFFMKKLFDPVTFDTICSKSYIDSLILNS